MDNDEITERVDQRVDQAQRIYERRGQVLRGLWVAAGVLVVLAGLAMIVVPGPVTVVVPAGLAMLAVKFAFARRLLTLSVRKGAEAKEAVEEVSGTAKVLSGLALACLAAAAAAVVLLWW